MLKMFGKAALAVGVGFLLVNLLFGGKGDKRDDLPTLVKNGALIVDTRTAGEFQNGHVKGAVNIPYDIIARAIDQYETDPSRPVIVYCRSGNRSAHAKRSLLNAGYTNVIDAGSISSMQQSMPK